MMNVPSCSIRQFALALAIATPLAAYAGGDLLAGVAYGGPQQRQAVCYLFNGGTSQVSISAKALIPEPPYGTTPFPFVYDTCLGSIAPGGVCAFVAQLTFNGGTACSVTLGNSKDVRASLEIRDLNNVILNNVELR
jgi:hypothetical protein